MYDVLFRQILEALKHLVNCLVGLPFRDGSSRPDASLQIAVRTDLRNDIAVVGTSEHLVAFHYVGVIQCFEDIDLGI